MKFFGDFWKFDDSVSSILEACGLSNKPVNAEKMVFGGTLSKHHVANIEVNFKVLGFIL